MRRPPSHQFRGRLTREAVAEERADRAVYAPGRPVEPHVPVESLDITRRELRLVVGLLSGGRTVEDDPETARILLARTARRLAEIDRLNETT